MELTDSFYSLLTKNIKLSADNIELEGLVTANENFKINTDGTCEVKDLIVTGSIIQLNDINQSGRENSSDHTYTSDNSLIYSDGVTFDLNSIEDSTPTNPPENTEVVKTSIIKSKGSYSNCSPTATVTITYKTIESE